MRKLLLCLFIMTLSIAVKGQDEKGFSINDSASRLQKAVFSPRTSIPFNDMKSRVRLYKNKRHSRHKRGWLVGKKYDAGSCWFDLKKINTFIAAINADLKQEDPSGNDTVSGLRFYYMVYRKADPLAPKNLKSSKKVHSLAIVATHIVIVKGIRYEFDIIDKESKVAALTVAINEGTLCPPQPPRDCKGAIIANSIYE